MAPHRDDTLRALLPSKHDEYSFESLSQAETDALEAAFGDGFGDVGAVGYTPMPPPAEVRRGLVRHPFFVRPTSEYDHEQYPDEFWDWNDDQPPPAESLPLGFVLRRLRLYFANQVDRLCARLIKEQPSYATIERPLLEELAMQRLYEKPWYELHAVQLLDWIETTPKQPAIAKNASFSLLLNSSFSGKLGRLVEQYYWRFRFEKAAITGVAARTGASTGGKAKAKLHVEEHLAWQKAAANIWTLRPKLSKTAVAKAIKTRLDVPQTAKHIARFIQRP
jgi:hypothetical protein